VCARGNLDLGTRAGSGGSKALPLLQDMLNDTPFINSSGPLYVSNGAGKIVFDSSSSCYVWNT